MEKEEAKHTVKMEIVSDKDKLIFCTKESHEKPSKYQLPPDIDRPKGIKLPDGSIDWSCPCLGRLPYGPCGFEFQEFFGCISAEKDSEEMKAQECFPKFASMKECFSKFPKLYPPDDEDDEEEQQQQKKEEV